jgi:hypothetical protein
MAITIETIPHSFIRLEEPLTVQQCKTQPKACLPILEPEDLVFQFIVKVSGADKIWFNVELDGLNETIWASLCQDCELIGELGAYMTTYRADYQRILEDETDVYIGSFYYNNNDAQFDMLNTFECFQLCFYRVQYDVMVFDGSITQFGLEPIACAETCLIKIDDDCLTTILLCGK